ncbi:hypothetical protein K469DRAFT_603066 [Zopfia rhizophila CBS 207.26]|uniref:Uncharacterized protein n=1 Tax=Zopfia rhizophila CBS 207.26 TaxID=1314779 RepID=A0A6A6DDH6_9PEZI|nr:hypothetical protein K469DRAFT_603066 [Zopfia rhizophila CBS 207.26]
MSPQLPPQTPAINTIITVGTVAVPLALLPSQAGIVLVSSGSNAPPLTFYHGEHGSFSGWEVTVATNALTVTIAGSVFNLTPGTSTVPSTAHVTVEQSSSTVTSIPLTSFQAITAPTPSQIQSASSSTPTVARKETGVSPGATSGIAIGCLLAGALIAGLVVWFCLGKAGNRRVRDQEASAVAFLHREKHANAKAQSLEDGSPISQIMGNSLPQPLEDKAISGEISKISNLVKNHVQSFYHNGRVSPGLLDLDDLQALGNDIPISAGTLSTLLGNSDTREIALRFCIAWVLVSRIQLYSNPSISFLPPEIAECFQSMPAIGRGPRVEALLLTNWRRITAELMQSSYIRNPFSVSDPRNHNIRGALEVLEGILQQYSDSRVDNNQRRQNLEEILKRGATFAFTLFAQPSTWNFDWQDEQGVKSGSLCVFPALVQVTDEAGDPLKPPRPFSEAVVRRLDG